MLANSGLSNQSANRLVSNAMSENQRTNSVYAKSIGSGVQEYRIELGPGYRIYFGRDGDRLVILLGGGTKNRQQDDIRDAQAYWADYRRRKRKEQ